MSQERDIRCKGEFSDNMKAKFDKDDVVMVKLPPKPGLAAVGSEDSRTWNSQRVGRTAGSQTAREALPSRSKFLNHATLDMCPLLSLLTKCRI